MSALASKDRLNELVTQAMKKLPRERNAVGYIPYPWPSAARTDAAVSLSFEGPAIRSKNALTPACHHPSATLAGFYPVGPTTGSSELGGRPPRTGWRAPGWM